MRECDDWSIFEKFKIIILESYQHAKKGIFQSFELLSTAVAAPVLHGAPWSAKSKCSVTGTVPGFKIVGQAAPLALRELLSAYMLVQCAHCFSGSAFLSRPE